MPRGVLLRIRWVAKRGGSAGWLGWRDRAEVLVFFAFFCFLLFGDDFRAVKLVTQVVG